jgi:hypothetical protein
MSSIEGKGKGKRKSKEELSDHGWSEWVWDQKGCQWYRSGQSKNGEYIYDYLQPEAAWQSNAQEDYRDITTSLGRDYQQPLATSTLRGNTQGDYQDIATSSGSDIFQNSS